MRKVHLVKGRVVYVYWINTVLVQNNLPTELSKRTFFIIYVYWINTVLVQNNLPTELSKRTFFIIYRKIC